MALDDFLFREDLTVLDPDVAALIGFEEARQARRLISVSYTHLTLPTIYSV